MTSLVPGSRRVAFLTNMLAPYRVPIYNQLAEHFDVTVLYSGHERNRTQWQSVADELKEVKVKRSRGIALSWVKRDRGEILDTKFLHLNPGFFSDLVKLKPDAVVTDELGFRTLTALVYGWLYGRPVWVWWGGTVHTERGVGLGKRLFRRLLVRRIRRWFSYGNTSTEYLVALGVPRTSIVELQNSIPEDQYLRPVPPAVQLEPKPVLLCVGRLVPGKGVDLLLQAAARVQAEGVSFSILLVGDGPEKGVLERKAAELGLDNVHFQAPRPPASMSAVYRSGDVLVFPTLDDVWGLVVNEALWSGLPALVSIYAGCARELVPPESTFDPLNLDDFASQVRRAVARQLPPPNVRRLKRIDEVSDLILCEVSSALRGSR